MTPSLPEELSHSTNGYDKLLLDMSLAKGGNPECVMHTMLSHDYLTINYPITELGQQC